ncbi:MAG TPA: hypothetical protein VMF89_18540, partial [Polyangiales bacterium]|nr:hypothetical protein [Polyangiales bacterium]
MIGSAKLLDGQSALQQGAGLVDVAAALDQPLHADPAAVSFGRQRWPHDDDSAVERTVNIHNDSDKDLTLELSIATIGPNGASADASLFTLSAPSVQIAAHGEAQVTLTADTRAGLDGVSSGNLIASDGTSTLHVPFIVEREVESYDLELKVVNWTGEPADPSTAWADVLPYDYLSLTFYQLEDDGTLDLRLPRGRYVVSANVEELEGDEWVRTAILVNPELTLEADTTFVLDAREAKLVQIDSPQADAELFGFSFSYDTVPLSSSHFMDGTGELYTAQVGAAGEVESLSSSFSAVWTPPGAPVNAAYEYNWAKTIAGEVVTGYRATFVPEDFIRIDAKFARGSSALDAGFMAMAVPADPEANYSASATSVPVELPSTRAIYVFSDPALAWELELQQFEP